MPAGLWIRSLSAPTVGIATLARLLRLTANGSSRRAAIFDFATTGSSASRVLFSPANVAVERLSVPGSSWRACWSATLWRATAPVVVLACSIRSLSCCARDANACIVCAPWTSSPSNAGSLRSSSAVRLLVLASPGARYLSVLFACADLPWMLAASPLMTPRSPARVSGSSESNTWSRLTNEYVWSSPIVPPFGISGASLGAGSSTMYRVATPDSEFS